MFLKSDLSLEYNRQIDGLRFFAVFGVLIFHFKALDFPCFNWIPFGYGVDLFFVISGYLITKILLVNKEKIILKDTSIKKVLIAFYFRRSLRIFPIYYLTIFYLLVINFQNTREVWLWLVTYTTNFYISLDHPYIGSFNHLWSLAVEEQFYLIWPFIILIIPKKNIGITIISLIIFSLLFKIFFFKLFGFKTALNALPISCFDSLGFGALVAYLSIYKNNILSKINSIKFLIPISFTTFLYFTVINKDFISVITVNSNFLFSVFAFFVISKASQDKFGIIIKYILENKYIVHFGKISYGIYLYHFFMPDFYNQMHDFFPHFFFDNSLLKPTIQILAAIIFSELSWFIIEKRLYVFKSKFKYV